jgi:hypothetical protein
MIKIEVDNAKEMAWIEKVLESGTSRFPYVGIFGYLGINLEQDIHFSQSDTYVDNLSEIVEAFKREFADQGIMEVENMLRIQARQQEETGNRLS